MKQRILFVDDEAKVLAALGRMLRGQRNEWDMEFVAGGRYGSQVLDALGKLLETEKGFTVAEVPIEALTTNMMLAEDVKTDKGALLIGKGHEITLALRQKLKNYYKNGHLPNKRIWVTVPDSSSGT